MIVITGGTGHIGNALVRELIFREENIRVVVPEFEDVSSIKDMNLDIVSGDVRDIDSLISAFKDAEFVYHLAGIVSINSGKKKLLHDVNVNGTMNVVKACMQTGAKRLVYVSSIHAFKEQPSGIPITETKDFDSSKVSGQYAKSKAEATREVLRAVDEGLDAVIVHPTGVIGPYEYKLSNMGQLIVDFVNGKLFAYIDGSYDFVDVRDVAKGIIASCENGRRGENYILSGQQITIKEILDILEEITGIKAPKAKIPIWLAKLTSPLSELYYGIKKQKPLYTPYSIKTITGNSFTTHEKASRELGYIARPIKESIADAVKWLEENK